MLLITTLLFAGVLALIILDLLGIAKLASPWGVFIGIVILPHECMIFGKLLIALHENGVPSCI